MQNLEAIIQTAVSTRYLTFIIPLSEQIVVLPVTPNGNVFIIDEKVGLHEFLQIIKDLTAEKVNNNLMSFSLQLNDLALKLKNHGILADSYICYRISLFIAIHCKREDGINAIARNIYVLLDQLKELTVRGNPVSFKVADEQFFAKTRQSFFQALEGDRDLIKEFKEKFGNTLSVMVTDAGEVLDHFEIKNDIQTIVNCSAEMVTGFYNLSSIASRFELRWLIIDYMLSVCNHPELFLKIILDEFARMEAVDRWNDAYFDFIWQSYLEAKEFIYTSIDKADLCSFYESAFNQFEYLAYLATTIGGAFPHMRNYASASNFQILGRDYLTYMLFYEKEIFKACELIERIRGKSLINWMGRNVAHTRLPKQFIFPFIINKPDGAINAVEPIGRDEMIEISRSLNTNVLSYFFSPFGLLVILQTTGREFICTTVNWQKIKPEVDHYFEKNSSGKTFNPPDKFFFKKVMHDLYLELFPLVIRDKLEWSETKNLLVLTDGELDFIPFCALLNSQRKYLIEVFELTYATSLTAVYLNQFPSKDGVTGGNLVYHPKRNVLIRAKPPDHDKSWEQPLLVGIREFGHINRLTGKRFSHLPGVGSELSLIGTMLDSPYYLDEKVNKDLLFEKGFYSNIMHIATHAYFDKNDPLESTIVLHDGLLTAREIYFSERGFRNGLVVLSACETGLGRVSSDTGFNLTNAFIVAGSKSVVSSLWRISDQATVELMKKLYNNILRGLNLSEALRNAQIDLLQDQQFNDPRYWAAFKLTGINKNPLSY